MSLTLSRLWNYAGVGLVLSPVATTTVMSVEDRIEEHPVLQTIGFSGPRVFRLVMTERGLLCVAGGLVGVGTALVMLQLSSLSVGAEAVTIAITPSIRLAISGLVVACITGAIAGIAAAIHAARAEIVPALRQA